jgi:hypothetical protein
VCFHSPASQCGLLCPLALIEAVQFSQLLLRSLLSTPTPSRLQRFHVCNVATLSVCNAFTFQRVSVCVTSGVCGRELTIWHWTAVQGEFSCDSGHRVIAIGGDHGVSRVGQAVSGVCCFCFLFVDSSHQGMLDNRKWQDDVFAPCWTVSARSTSSVSTFNLQHTCTTPKAIPPKPNWLGLGVVCSCFSGLSGLN